MGSVALTDAELTALAGATHSEELSVGLDDVPDKRLHQLQAFSFLKSLRLVPAKKPFSPKTQAKIQALLPKAKLEFQ